MKKLIISFILAAGIFPILTADKYGPGGDYTGAPLANGNPGSTCATTNCHTGSNNLGGSMTVTVTKKDSSTPVLKYEAGKTYTVKVHAAGTSAVNYGFSATILDPSRLKTGTTNGAGTGVSIKSYNNRSIAMHNTPSSTGIFTFNWTAPATSVPDSVTLYVAVNVANGKDNESGDQILTGSMRLRQLPASAATAETNKPSIALFPNPCQHLLHLSETTEHVSITDASAKLVFSGNKLSQLDVSQLPAGLYWLSAKSHGKMQVLRFVKTN